MTPQSIVRKEYEADERVGGEDAYFKWAFRVASWAPGPWMRCTQKPTWCLMLEYSRISDLDSDIATTVMDISKKL